MLSGGTRLSVEQSSPSHAGSHRQAPPLHTPFSWQSAAVEHAPAGVGGSSTAAAAAARKTDHPRTLMPVGTVTAADRSASACRVCPVAVRSPPNAKGCAGAKGGAPAAWDGHGREAP